MRIKATKVLPVLATIVALAALGCSGEQTPGDTGVGEDTGSGNGDKPVLCQANEECGPGMECRGGVCMSTTSCNCNYDCDKAKSEICNPATHQCETGQPPLNCRDDCDCYSGYHCNFGTCVPESTGCKSDSDCTETEYPRCNTETGECIPECVNDIDCPLPGQVCVNNHCISPDCTRESCPQGQWCDVSDGQCKPGCDENSDCVSPETCNYSTHQCGQTDCCGGVCDPQTQYCDALTCQCVEKCQTDADCPSGFECQADGKCWCTPNNCPQGTHCDPVTGDCVQDTVQCQTDADCPLGWTCNQATHECETQATANEGATCYSDDQCDQTTDPPLMCDNCFLCFFFDPNFIPTYTCRFECSIALNQCPIADRDCQYRNIPFQGLCMPP